MSKYILLLRGDKETAYAHLGPEGIQKVIERYMAWQKNPFVVGGAGLIDKTGRVLRKKDGSVSVTEGPFSESREVMGGFFTIEAASFEEAAKLSADNPHLDFGTIEVREVK
jgi:hypothetical protein